MSTQAAGVLRDPFERPLANTDIDIRAITNTFAILPGNTIKVTTNAQGEYNFVLEPANYAVSVILDGRSVYQGVISITSTTAPGTLPELLKQAEMESELPLNYGEYFHQIQETVKDDADRAQAAANGIQEQVDEARDYAQQSASSASKSEQSSQSAQQALSDTQVIASKFQNLDQAVTQTQQNAAQTAQDAQQTAADRTAADSAAKRAEDAADSAETVNERNIRVPQNETINALPAASSRANSVVSFDSAGQSTVTPLSSIAPLDSTGKVPIANIPVAAITEVFTVSSQAAMTSLAADPGDVAIVNNTSTPSENGSFILMASPASTLSNWKYLSDNVLVQLAMNSGAAKIGTSSGQNVQQYINGLPSSLVLAQPKSGNFWIDVHANAKIHRQNDRVLMGGAADNDGKITTDRTAANKDWLEVIRYSTTNNSQLAVLSTIGQCAVLGGSKSSDSTLTDSMGCIGLQGWAINDNTTQIQTAYGAYLEVRRSAGAGRTHGFELDMVNYGNAVSLQPYDMFQQGLTAGGWFASGGEIAATRASAAIAIVNNGATFEKGIIFHSKSIDGTDGVTGSGVAIEMAKGQALRWMFGSGSVGATFSSDVSNAAAQQAILFSDVGTLIRNSASKNMLQVQVSNSFVNGLTVTPAASGTGVSLAAQGDDTNIDIRIVPKGTGVIDVRNATVTGSAGSQLGYLTIKISGTPYKIPLYNV